MTFPPRAAIGGVCVAISQNIAPWRTIGGMAEEVSDNTLK